MAVMTLVFIALALFHALPVMAQEVDRDLAGVDIDIDSDYLEPDPFEEDHGADAPVVRDPLEPVNRLFFAFNDKLYFWVVKPVAKGYDAVMPVPVQTGIRNFFANLRTPIRLVNNLLQGELRGAGTELGRFLLNSTVGVAGIFDVADARFNLSPRVEDLGQTLGRYGLGDGFYICWPVFGPSSLRDSIGLAGDSYLSPLSYLTREELWAGVSAYSLKRVNVAHENGKVYIDLQRAPLDP